jgi:16S rRNA (adenine1518-N6/adenine1519-N6)-dimethyltransferase
VAKVSPSGVRKSTPKLGQHFLSDPVAASRIIEALGDIAQKTVLEVGPGRGAITGLLAKRARRLIAVELDRVLSAQLRMKFSLWPNVEILEGDILSVDFDTIFGPRPGTAQPGLEIRPEKASVVGNLPYYITSELLLKLFAYRKYFDSFVVMVQLEVADRLAAQPGTRDYGLLSATAQLYTRPEKLFALPPGAFSPPPKVQSAVVRMKVEPRLEQLQVPEEAFLNFLRLSFGQKRKTLSNNLKPQYDAKVLRAALQANDIDASVRAEALPLETSAALFRALEAQNQR